MSKYNGPRLREFYTDKWATGLTFDLTKWGGEAIKVGKVKPAKKVRKIKPSISVLTDNEDQAGRSLADHRAMVEYYGAMYDSKKELFTGEPITDKEETKGCEKPRVDTPWAGKRGMGNHKNEGLELLTQAFKNMHTNTEDDD